MKNQVLKQAIKILTKKNMGLLLAKNKKGILRNNFGWRS